MKKLNNFLIVVMLIINIGALIYSFNGYQVNKAICIALSIIIFLPRIIKNKISISSTIEFVYLMFVLIAGTIGSVLKVYDLVWWYDSLAHFISGTLSALLGLILLIRFKKNDKSFFNILFIISFVLAVAAFWEIFEFTSDSLLGLDAQRVLETGVTDTMKDIILAFLGGNLFLTIFMYSKNNVKQKLLDNLE